MKILKLENKSIKFYKAMNLFRKVNRPMLNSCKDKERKLTEKKQLRLKEDGIIYRTPKCRK